MIYLAFLVEVCYTVDVKNGYFMTTCYEFLQQGADRDGCIVYLGHKLSTRDFLADVERIAGALSQLGLSEGDVITLQLPTCPQSLALFYACSKLGLICSVVHPMVPVNLLAENIRKTKSKALFFYDVTVRDERLLAGLDQILVRCSVADYVRFRKPFYKLYSVLGGRRLRGILTYSHLLKSGEGIATQVGGTPDSLLCYMHSGGTSGEPKIVKLTNRAFQSVVDGMWAMYHPDVRHGDFNLATLPVFHAYGLCSALHGPLSVGYSLILIPQFDVKAVARSFDKYNVKVWSVVPAMLKKMLARRCFDRKGLSDLDVIWCGGDVCEESLAEQVDGILSKYGNRAKLMRGYGLTEMCGVCVVNNFDYYKKGSCGRPMPGFSVQIWDDNGNELAPGVWGEIVVSGGGAMSGYLEGDDSLTERDGKTWVKTGDVGYLDDGFLYVIDRKKRSLKIAAVNVFPSQIETCVEKIDFVSECCAVGVKVDGKQFVKVYVTLKYPMNADEVKARITDHCRKNLIRYAVPRFVEVIDSMPRTPLGKIDFRALESKN